jgi:flagellar M-ring protein FliF
VNETVLQYWTRIKQYWNRFSSKQKAVIVSTAVILIAAAALISYNMSKTVYKTAFTDLQPDAAAAIKSHLASTGISYVLSPDGKTISVPESKVAEVIVDAASQNLVNGGSGGFAVFRGSSTFGTTDKEFNVKYVDALQGELRNLIRSLQPIADAEVLINFPEQSVFLQQNKNLASASVVLKLKTGYKVDQSLVDTVYNLVMHSIKDLPLSNITVSDQYGKRLVATDSGGTTQGLGDIESHLAIKSRFENDIKGNVTNLLGAFFDPNKVIVNVTSNMNFDQVNAVENLVTAPNQADQKGLEISLQQATKSYTSDGGSTAGGVPGTGPQDVPSYPSSSGQGKVNSEESSKTVNSEVNRIQNNIKKTPYAVKDLSITVGIEPPIPNDPNSLSQATRDEIQQALISIVRIAVAGQGQAMPEADLAKRVQVIPHSFARNTQAAQAGVNANWIYAGLGGLAALLLVFGGFALARRRKNRLADQNIAMPMKVEHPSIDFESQENQVRKQLETLARKKPEDFVNLLRTWLIEE